MLIDIHLAEAQVDQNIIAVRQVVLSGPHVCFFRHHQKEQCLYGSSSEWCISARIHPWLAFDLPA